MIRNSYEPPGHSLRLDGKKVQQLVDDYVRSLNIEDIMDPREVTYNNILGYVSKFKTERARTALIPIYSKLKAAIAPQSADSPVLFVLISNAIGTSDTNIFPTISLARSLFAIL